MASRNRLYRSFVLLGALYGRFYIRLRFAQAKIALCLFLILLILLIIQQKVDFAKITYFTEIAAMAPATPLFLSATNHPAKTIRYWPQYLSLLQNNSPSIVSGSIQFFTTRLIFEVTLPHLRFKANSSICFTTILHAFSCLLSLFSNNTFKLI